MDNNSTPPLPEITKGSVLYRAFSDRRDGLPREVTVTSVGREWIHVDDPRTKRFHKDNLISDDGGRARLYASKAAYDEEVARQANWNALRKMISATYKVPDNVSSESMIAALKLLAPPKTKTEEI